MMLLWKSQEQVVRVRQTKFYNDFGLSIRYVCFKCWIHYTMLQVVGLLCTALLYNSLLLQSSAMDQRVAEPSRVIRYTAEEHKSFNIGESFRALPNGLFDTLRQVGIAKVPRVHRGCSGGRKPIPVVITDRQNTISNSDTQHGITTQNISSVPRKTTHPAEAAEEGVWQYCTDPELLWQ